MDRDRIGNVRAWTELPQLVLIPLVPRPMKRFDPRFGIAAGFALFAASAWRRWSKGARIVALCLLASFLASPPADLLVSVQR